MFITKHDFIRTFIQLGIAVMPLYHRSKEPMLPAWRELQTRLPTNTEHLAWFATDWNNYGVIAGWCNLVIIDFDNIEYFNLWQLWISGTSNWMVNEVGFKVRTRHGVHVYVCTETPAANDKRISVKGGIDVQAQGKYVVGPLSIHPSGSVYEPIGEIFFPMVSDIESILPLDLFPRVRAEDVVFTGAPVEFQYVDTEQECDPFVAASMGNISLVEKVKRAVRIETLFSGVQRSSIDGRWLKARCLFHDDAHQSAWIDTERQLAGCQVCGMKPMDAVNLFGRMHNLSNGDAVIALAQEIGIWK